MLTENKDIQKHFQSNSISFVFSILIVNTHLNYFYSARSELEGGSNVICVLTNLSLIKGHFLAIALAVSCHLTLSLYILLSNLLFLGSCRELREKDLC